MACSRVLVDELLWREIGKVADIASEVRLVGESRGVGERCKGCVWQGAGKVEHTVDSAHP